jgi:kanamycin kinase/aminoglycoside 3'-phosphotransferase-2
VVEAMADFARELHTLPVADCPFRRDPDTAVPDAEQAVALGLVDVEDFDEHRVGTDPETLLAELRRTRPAAEIIDPVVAHGDYCVPNVLIDPKTMRVSGIIDLGRLGIADRHQDLALAHRSLRDDGLNEQYGPAFAEHFLNHYGLAADPARMEWHELLDEFC